MMGATALDGFDFTKTVLFKPASNTSHSDAMSSSTTSITSSASESFGLCASATPTTVS